MTLKASRVALCVLIVLVAIHLVPFAVYGTATALGIIQPPEREVAGAFMVGVFVEKAGHALTFVLLFVVTRRALHGRWLLYGVIWWLLFALGEIGTALRGGFSWPEAIAGIVSETVYVPVSALITNRLLVRGCTNPH